MTENALKRNDSATRGARARDDGWRLLCDVLLPPLLFAAVDPVCFLQGPQPFCPGDTRPGGLRVGNPLEPGDHPVDGI